MRAPKHGAARTGWGTRFRESTPGPFFLSTYVFRKTVIRPLDRLRGGRAEAGRDAGSSATGRPAGASNTCASGAEAVPFAPSRDARAGLSRRGGLTGSLVPGAGREEAETASVKAEGPGPGPSRSRVPRRSIRIGRRAGGTLRRRRRRDRTSARAQGGARRLPSVVDGPTARRGTGASESLDDSSLRLRVDIARKGAGAGGRMRHSSSRRHTAFASRIRKTLVLRSGRLSRGSGDLANRPDCDHG